MKYVFHNGLITLLQADQKPGAQQAIGRLLAPLVKWANEHNKNVLREMMPQGKFIFNTENTQKTLTLLQEWKINAQ